MSRSAKNDWPPPLPAVVVVEEGEAWEVMFMMRIEGRRGWCFVLAAYKFRPSSSTYIMA